jgi:hypothetical protein
MAKSSHLLAQHRNVGLRVLGEDDARDDRAFQAFDIEAQGLRVVEQPHGRVGSGKEAGVGRRRDGGRQDQDGSDFAVHG